MIEIVKNGLIKVGLRGRILHIFGWSLWEDDLLEAHYEL